MFLKIYSPLLLLPERMAVINEINKHNNEKKDRKARIKVKDMYLLFV